MTEPARIKAVSRGTVRGVETFDVEAGPGPIPTDAEVIAACGVHNYGGAVTFAAPAADGSRKGVAALYID